MSFRAKEPDRRAPARHRVGQWGCAWARNETSESMNGSQSGHCTARGIRGGRLGSTRAIQPRWFTKRRCLGVAAGSRSRSSKFKAQSSKLKVEGRDGAPVITWYLNLGLRDLTAQRPIEPSTGVGGYRVDKLDGSRGVGKNADRRPANQVRRSFEFVGRVDWTQQS